MSFDKEQLKLYRLERARGALSEAEILFASEKVLGTVNRLYYACFYAVSAYLLSQKMTAITHSGLKTIFNLELIKTGRLEASYGQFFNKLFTYRQEADYDDGVSFTVEEVAQMLLIVSDFITEIEKIVDLE